MRLSCSSEILYLFLLFQYTTQASMTYICRFSLQYKQNPVAVFGGWDVSFSLIE